MNIIKNLLIYKKTFILVFGISFALMMVSQFVFIQPQYAVKSLLFCGRVISFETKASTFVDVSVNHLENPVNIAEYIRTHYKSIDGFGGLNAYVLKKSPFHLSLMSYGSSLEDAKAKMFKIEKKLQQMLQNKVKINQDLVLLEKENYKSQYENLKNVGAQSQQGYNMNLMELTSLNRVIYHKLEQASVPGFLSNVKLGEITNVSSEPVTPNRKVLTCFILLLSTVLGLISVLFAAELRS